MNLFNSRGIRHSWSPSFLSVFFQLCQVLSPTSMLCQAPELPISLARQQEVLEKPDEFGFKLDDVQSLMALNNSNFIYYPNPEFELLSVSGVLELKPGSPIILKVGHLNQGLMVENMQRFNTVSPAGAELPPSDQQWKRKAELYSSDRWEALHVNGVRNPAALWVAQPDRATQGSGECSGVGETKACTHTRDMVQIDSPIHWLTDRWRFLLLSFSHHPLQL